MEQPTKYDANAEQYAEMFLAENEKSTAIYHAQFDSDLAGKKILDLGCGEGRPSHLSIFGKKKTSQGLFLKRSD